MATVLITKFREFTDVIMTLPVIYSACGSHPEDDFVLVTRTSLVSLFLNAPSNLRVEGANPDDYASLGQAKKLWKELKEQYKPNVLVDLDDNGLSKRLVFWARLSGCRISSVKEPRNKKLLIRKNNKVMLPLISARARYREAFFRVGLPVQEHFEGLFRKGGKGDSKLFAALSAPPKPGEIWIGIAPFAKHQGKIYPLELMEEVVTMVEQELPNARIFMFGGGNEERKILDKLSASHVNVISTASAQLGLAAELSLLSYMNVMLTMDSANMHLASLVGVDVITIWGATHPYTGFKGWHQKERANISLPMPCRPCSMFGDKPCHRNDYMCMTSIKPRLVADMVISTLKKEKDDEDTRAESKA
ncbi:MAG: glycosyltransferase family 9 protein [Muribaculaceae bacterium]|nr:glycosyltransferase family 9 protein [Muribaculaceae bacterium]